MRAAVTLHSVAADGRDRHRLARVGVGESAPIRRYPSRYQVYLGGELAGAVVGFPQRVGMRTVGRLRLNRDRAAGVVVHRRPVQEIVRSMSAEVCRARNPPRVFDLSEIPDDNVDGRGTNHVNVVVVAPRVRLAVQPAGEVVGCGFRADAAGEYGRGEIDSGGRGAAEGHDFRRADFLVVVRECLRVGYVVVHAANILPRVAEGEGVFDCYVKPLVRQSRLGARSLRPRYGYDLADGAEFASLGGGLLSQVDAVSCLDELFAVRGGVPVRQRGALVVRALFSRVRFLQARRLGGIASQISDGVNA